MKNIGIFCDGTWQHIAQPFPTNVAALAQATQARVNVEGREAAQVVYYDDGVGVSQGVLDRASHVLGGALGKGLDYKIIRAYEFLALNYEPGDRIFIFGFSRGAYTARSLGGLIRWLGILKREYTSHAFEAMAYYRSRSPKPASPAEQDAASEAFETLIKPFRNAYAHPTSPFTGPSRYEPGRPSSLHPDDREGEATWIQYLGVWDTVGSLGIPTNLPFAAELDAKYRFYDPSLSHFVRSGRHAVSIDERRKTFSPTLWDNVADLNTNSAANELAYDLRPYQQKWFPGGHGCVGGGGPDGGLSRVPLLWVAEGAVRAGFGFEDGLLQHFENTANPAADFEKRALNLGDFVLELDGLEDRTGPTTFDEVSLSARLRYLRRIDYKPAPLKAVATAIQAFQPQPDPQRYFSP